MNINSKCKIAGLASFILAGSLFDSACFAGGPAPKFSYEWKISDFKSETGVVTIPEKESGNDIIGAVGSGLSVVDDAKVSGGKAMVFDGTQKIPAEAKNKIEAGEDISIQLEAKPTEKGGGIAQCLVYIYKQCELRYLPEKGLLEWYVWYSESGESTCKITLPIQAGKWSKIEAFVKGGKMQLSVNGDKVKGEIPDKFLKRSGKDPLFLGYGPDRPYAGAIADLQISSK